MKESSDIVACFCDHGLFLPMALTLGKQLKKVYYWSPQERTLPLIADGMVGDGFDEIERVDSPWEVKDECQLYVFPDVGFSGLQKELRSQGKPVWGHNGGDVIETSRGKFMEMVERLGMDVAPYEIITGLKNLRLHLKDKSDKWVKISKWRGDWETLHWRSWREDEATLDEYAFKMGPAKDLITFYVFDEIETDLEDGIDTYCIDGQWPKTVIHGMEKKDKSFLCSVQPLTDIHESVSHVNELMGPELAKFGYRGFFSSEVRIAGEKSYFIDPTCRAASPPSQVMAELFGNLGDIIWQGANGNCVEPEATATYGVQALITCDRGPDEWAILELPERLKPYVRCGFATEIDGRLCIPPHQLGHMLGWLVATGDTVSDAIESLKERAKELPCGVDCDVQSLACLLMEAAEAKSQGISIGGNIPKPEVVL